MTSKATTLWNGEVGYRVSSRARLVVEGVHTHPAIPRTARISLQVSF